MGIAEELPAQGGGDDDNPDGSGRNAGRNFHGERRSNDTHQSTTDPEARMARKSFAHPARLCYAGHVLMEHRHGLVADAVATQATGRAERETAIEMLTSIPGEHRITVAGDKAYDTRGFADHPVNCNRCADVGARSLSAAW